MALDAGRRATAYGNKCNGRCKYGNDSPPCRLVQEHGDKVSMADDLTAMSRARCMGSGRLLEGGCESQQEEGNIRARYLC
jgi:hypothetical protein